jgi:hypothetical protein
MTAKRKNKPLTEVWLPPTLSTRGTRIPCFNIPLKKVKIAKTNSKKIIFVAKGLMIHQNGKMLNKILNFQRAIKSFWNSLNKNLIL